MNHSIENMLTIAGEKSASDLHLNVGRPPMLRIDGKLQKMSGAPSLEEQDLQEILKSTTTPEQMNKFLIHKELDFSFDNPLIGRFRVSACVQKNAISLAFRLLMGILSPLSSLGLPSIYGDISLKRRGLILVTGPTGSGKSTSMAAMVDNINNTLEKHIITIEDPIEYVYKDNKSLIIQRNVGEDTESFASALKNALRHDPDVIVIGEMRDLTTINIALSAAETGHLVFGTLHTLDAGETIDRIVEVFSAEQQAQIRLQLSQVLVAVLSQTLVPCIGGGRIPACEIMISNTAIKNTIREGQSHQLYNNIQMGQHEGMQTLNQSLVKLVEEKIISIEDAVNHCSNVSQFEQLMKFKKTDKMKIPVGAMR